MNFERVMTRAGLGLGLSVLALVSSGQASAQTLIPAQYQVLTPAPPQREDTQRPVPPERADKRSHPAPAGAWHDFSLLRAVVPKHWFPLASGLLGTSPRDEADVTDVQQQEPGDREVAQVAGSALHVEQDVSAAPEPGTAERAACTTRLAGVMEQGSITFASGGSTIAAESRAVLSAVAEVLQACSNERLYVEGHTDATGDAAVNLALSVARAEAVVDGLIELGISPSRLFALGYGASLPIADNETAAGRQANRRIVLSFEDNAVPR